MRWGLADTPRDVYSTPSMISDMEYHVRDMLLALLPDGWDSLGTHVTFDHSAATLEGETVEMTSTVTVVDGRSVEAETVFADRVGELGRGIHRRFIVDMAKNESRLEQRLAELEALPSPAAPTNFLRSYGQENPPAWLTELGAKAKALGEVGFDQYCNGPWLQGFEAEVAALMGKEAGMFVVTGTMAQQLAIQAHAEAAADPGTTGYPKVFAAHPSSHLLLSEEDSFAALGGFSSVVIGPPDRPLGAAATRAALEAAAAEGSLPSTLLVEIPQRHNGGACTPYEELVALRALCDEFGIAFHMDGARLWEAQPGYGRPFEEICALFDSVYLSFCERCRLPLHRVRAKVSLVPAGR